MKLIMLIVVLLFGDIAAAAELRPRRQPMPAPMPMEVNRAEILRCGDQCEFISGHGSAQTPAAAVSNAMSLPADDSDKFFVSIIREPGGEPGERLVDDWSVNPWLKAVGIPGSLDSWSHCTVYDANDRSQDWRWTDISFKGFPSVVISAPRSGIYGDPATVVYQSDGYDGDARGLAEAMTTAIRDFVTTFSSRQQSTEPAATAPPPWEGDQAEKPRPRPLADRLPRVPPAERPLLKIIPWSLLISGLAGGITLPLIIGVVVFALRRIRSHRVASGSETILSDEQMNRLVEFLTDLGDDSERESKTENKKRARKKPR